MSKEVKKNENIYEALKTLYFSGKVKPTLNKIVTQLESDSKNIELSLLACQCSLRAKDFDKLTNYANQVVKLDAKESKGYYYKGVSCKHTKGKEQEAIKNFSEALALDPDNTIYLRSKAETHLLLYKDYDLPVKFAEKHRDKAEVDLLQIVNLIEQKETPSYVDFLTIGDVSILLNQAINAKKYYIKAVNAFDTAPEVEKDMNTYKDIIKSQKECIKLLEKFSE